MQKVNVKLRCSTKTKERTVWGRTKRQPSATSTWTSTRNNWTGPSNRDRGKRRNKFGYPFSTTFRMIRSLFAKESTWRSKMWENADLCSCVELTSWQRRMSLSTFDPSVLRLFMWTALIVLSNSKAKFNVWWPSKQIEKIKMRMMQFILKS